VDDTSVLFANAGTVERLLDYPSLIQAIRSAFVHPPTTTQRLAVPIAETEQQPGGIALVVPSLRSAGRHHARQVCRPCARGSRRGRVIVPAIAKLVIAFGS
jgi:hypothetical protein